MRNLMLFWFGWYAGFSIQQKSRYIWGKELHLRRHLTQLEPSYSDYDLSVYFSSFFFPINSESSLLHLLNITQGNNLVMLFVVFLYVSLKYCLNFAFHP